MKNDIKYIQNELWSMYKSFLEDYSTKKYTQKGVDLIAKYADNAQLKTFVQHLLITWTPIINGLAKKHRNEEMANEN